jgi:hypothetical protein
MADPILILHRYNGTPIYSDAAATTKREAVINAVRAGVRLDYADLSGIDLNGASLNGASLNRASLNGASLNGASLDDASLNRASLNGASLNGASLNGASLNGIRDDLWSRLALAPAEVLGLLVSLRLGRINGSTYEGECACFVGTIANVCGKRYNALADLRPDAGSPTERWFMGLRPGDTPERSSIAKITEAWIVEWLRANRPEAVAALDADDALVAEQKALGDNRVRLAAKEDAPGLRELIKQHIVIPLAGSAEFDSDGAKS